MQKLYVISAIFIVKERQIDRFWSPMDQRFVLELPRGQISQSGLPSALLEAELGAREAIGTLGKKVSFMLRAVEVQYIGPRIVAAQAVGKEWVTA